MQRKPELKSWGDPELDRLWRLMYEIEMGMDDMDLAEDSPKLKRWEAVNVLFRQRMESVDLLRRTHA